MQRAVRYVPAGGAGGTAVTKLGGSPTWLRTPQWPLSKTLGLPMSFIGQFRLDPGAGGEVRMAYVFMTDSNTLDIVAEEAALENGTHEDYVSVEDVYDTFDPEGGENAVIVQPGGRVPSFVTVRELREDLAFTDELVPVDRDVAPGETPWDILGGEPVWLQGDETPGPGWRFVGQLTENLEQFFGDGGTGYVFLSPDGAEGRFLWQCH